jgi:hypothetical protein
MARYVGRHRAGRSFLPMPYFASPRRAQKSETPLGSYQQSHQLRHRVSTSDVVESPTSTKSNLAPLREVPQRREQEIFPTNMGPQEASGTSSTTRSDQTGMATVLSYTPLSLSEQAINSCRLAADRLATEELRSLATRLVVTNERLFDQYDRLSAEASLRLNIGPPVIALSLVLGIRFNLAFFLGLLAGMMILRQGGVRARDANDVLVQSVITGLITSTEISNVTQYVLANEGRSSDATWLAEISKETAARSDKSDDPPDIPN